MKKVLLNSFLSLFICTAVFSQAVIINSPPSLAGAYIYGVAQFGPALTDQIWCGDAVVIMDATSNPPTLGCDPNILNAADLVGKFVLIDRGVCNFSLKAFNGQLAGATACIIFNNVIGGGVQAMAAGTNGADVTIPTVMLSYEDGVKIKAALANGETVNFCLGNITFPNNLATNNRTALCHAPFGAYPAPWLKQVDDYVITPGATITNNGDNLATGVRLNTKMSFTPSGGSPIQFYNKTTDQGIFIEVDSANRITTDPIDIFGAIGGVGKGSIEYTASSDSTESTPADNSATSEFHLTGNTFSKARLATNGMDPFITTSYRRSDGTPAEYVSFYTIPYCTGCKIDTILFNLAINAPATLAGLLAEANLYEWDDLNADGDATNNELKYLAVGTYTYDPNETRTSVIARVPLEDFVTGTHGYIIPRDNYGVLIGVRYGGAEPVFFGFDEGIDYLCDNELKTNAGTLRIDDLPYLGITGYDPNSGVPDVENAAFRFTGLTAPIASSMVMSGIVGNKELSELDAKVKLYPNPVTERFQVSIVLNEITNKMAYSILDNTGRILFQSTDKNPAKEFETRFNVQNLSNGIYHLLIRTDKGFKQVSFEVLK